MKTTTITLPNGSTAIDFTPQDSKEKAIVHLSVLKRLASYLPKADPVDIINNLLNSIHTDYPHDQILERNIEVLEDFISFHRSVNLIEMYHPEPVECNHVPDPSMNS